MTTILTQGDGDHERRCDATCHNAKHQRCTCICGGRYHGKGTVAAQELLTQDVLGSDWQSRFQAAHPSAGRQGTLFTGGTTMGKNRAQFDIVKSDATSITIRDVGRGRTVTNDAEAVVREMHDDFGLGARRLFYHDSTDQVDELVHDGAGRFLQFAPGPRGDARQED